MIDYLANCLRGGAVTRHLVWPLAACCFLALSACGGGSASDPATAAASAPTGPGSSGGSSQPPTISGSPSTTAAVGAAYTFVPSTTDPSGKSLSFSIQNKPAWATFSSTTGTLAGTPAAADVGTASNIMISVTDGSASVSLTAFAITVKQPAPSGTATVSWVAPTLNNDSSPLTDLAGFHIYYGTNSASLSQSVTVADKTATNYQIANLSSATWYFAVKAVDTSGLESDFSNVVSKAVP